MNSERAFIVIMSYIIGFTTAYIAFGVNDNNSEKQVVNYQQAKELRSEKESPNSKSIGTSVKQDGLYALIGDNERILSAQLVSSDITRTDGYHKEVVSTAVSDDGRYIYYCTTMDGGKCDGFIYEIVTDVVRRVTDENKNSVEQSVDDTQANWLPGNILKLNNYISRDGSEPWYMERTQD